MSVNRISITLAAIVLASSSSLTYRASGQPNNANACSNQITKNCLIKLITDEASTQAKPSVELAEALALAGRKEAARSAAAKIGAEARTLVLAITLARAGDIKRALQIAGKAPPPIKDRAIGAIATAAARSGDLDQAIRLAGQVAAPDARARTYWRIAMVQSLSSTGEKLGTAVDSALRLGTKHQDNVWLALSTLAKRGGFDAIIAFATHRRSDGKLWPAFVFDGAVNHLIDGGQKEAARRLVERLEKVVQSSSAEELKYMAQLVMRSYAKLRSPAAVKRLFKRHSDQIDPAVFLSSLAQSGDALTAIVVAWGTKHSSLSPEIVIGSQVFVAIGQFRSGDRAGARKTSNRILKESLYQGAKKLSKDTASDYRLRLLAGTAQIKKAIRWAERLKSDTFWFKSALAWHVLPYVTWSRDTSAITRFLGYLAETKILPINIDEGDFHLICDEIARKFWSGEVEQSRAIAEALLRASLADPKSSEWDHEGVGACQFRAGDSVGAITTIRKMSDVHARRRFYLMVLKLQFGL